MVYLSYPETKELLQTKFTFLTVLQIEYDDMYTRIVCGSNKSIGDHEKYEVKIFFDQDEKSFGACSFIFDNSHWVSVPFDMPTRWTTTKMVPETETNAMIEIAELIRNFVNDKVEMFYDL